MADFLRDRVSSPIDEVALHHYTLAQNDDSRTSHQYGVRHRSLACDTLLFILHFLLHTLYTMHTAVLVCGNLVLIHILIKS